MGRRYRRSESDGPAGAADDQDLAVRKKRRRHDPYGEKRGFRGAGEMHSRRGRRSPRVGLMPRVAVTPGHEYPSSLRSVAGGAQARLRHFAHDGPIAGHRIHRSGPSWCHLLLWRHRRPLAPDRPGAPRRRASRGPRASRGRHEEAAPSYSSAVASRPANTRPPVMRTRPSGRRAASSGACLLVMRSLRASRPTSPHWRCGRVGPAGGTHRSFRRPPSRRSRPHHWGDGCCGPLATAEAVRRRRLLMSTTPMHVAALGTPAVAPGRSGASGGGASTGGDDTKTAETYDPVTGDWSVWAKWRQARLGATATLLKDGRVSCPGVTRPWASADPGDLRPRANAFTGAGNLSSPRKGHAAALLPGRPSPDRRRHQRAHRSRLLRYLRPSTGSVTPARRCPTARVGLSATALLERAGPRRQGGNDRTVDPPRPKSMTRRPARSRRRGQARRRSAETTSLPAARSTTTS